MSTAYFIVLNREVDFDPFVNGKNIARSIGILTGVCEKAGLRSFDDFTSQDLSEFAEEGFDVPEVDVTWYHPDEGLEWLNKLLIAVKGLDTPEDELVQELIEYVGVLEKARDADANWHFEIDY